MSSLISPGSASRISTWKSESIDLEVMLRQLADEFYPTLSAQELSLRGNGPVRAWSVSWPTPISWPGSFDNLLRNAAAYSDLRNDRDPGGDETAPRRKQGGRGF